MLCRALCILLFLAWTAEAPNDVVVYSGLWRSPLQAFGPLFVTLPGVGQSPWQLLLLAMAPLCLVQPGALRRRAAPMSVAIVVSVASIGVTAFWGWQRGGSIAYAYMQLWKFLTALLLALLLSAVVRSTRDLKTLAVTVTGTAVVRATLAIYFYHGVVKGRIFPMPEYLTTHEDSLLFVGCLLILISWSLARRSRRTWIATTLLCVYVLYAIVLNRRRLAWLEIIMALCIVYLLSPRGQRWRINRFLLLAAPFLLLYLAVGSHIGGPLGEPVRALKTSGSDEDASSRARFEENRNLVYTLSAKGDPLLGTGWGLPYAKVTSVYANFANWQEYLYLPHNSLLGVAVFSGLVGIAGIWLVVPIAAFLGTRGYRSSRAPVDRAAAMAAVAILPAYAAQCSGDIGFNQLSCALVLGMAMAVTEVVYVRSEGGRAPRRRGVGEVPDPPDPVELVETDVDERHAS